jgi:hypothetical protein
MLRRIVLACGALLMVGGSIQATAATSLAAAMTNITGQATYMCEGGTPTFGPNAGTVGVRLSLSVPPSVQPGQRLALTGVLSFELSAKDSASAKLLGITSSDMHSDTFSIAIQVGKQVVRVPANPWDSGPQPTSNPVVLTAPISFHTFTVPADAAGSLQIFMPYQDVVASNVPHTKRKSVAETTVSVNQISTGPATGYSGCWFPYSPRPSVGRIAVASPGTPATTGGKSPTGLPSGGGASPSPAGVGATVPSVGASSSGPLAPSSGGGVETTSQGAITGQTVPDAQGYTTAVAPSTTDTHGVYVSSGLLVLSGFLICFCSLSYALLANVRLRNLRKTLEG